MEKSISVAFLLACAWLLSAAAVQAATVNVSSSAGSSFNTTTLTASSTTGAGMSGMEVTVCTILGCSTSTWSATGANAGSASSTGWSLSLTGNSFSNPFTFTSTVGVTGFSLNGRPGSTVFDIIFAPHLSPLSVHGAPFELPRNNPNTDLQGWGVDVNYTDRLLVGGEFYNDLFTVMNVDLIRPQTAGFAGFVGTFQFIADTDNSASPILPVPEPGILALLGIGLMALLSMRRRANGGLAIPDTPGL